MFCRHCGQKIFSFDKACRGCNKHPLKGTQHCQECGEIVRIGDLVCGTCGKELRSVPFDTPLKVTGDENSHISYVTYPSAEKKEPIKKVIDINNYDEAEPIANLGTFCITPLIGFILYFVWMNDRPKAALSICRWTIAGVIMHFILYSIGFMIGLL